MRYDAGEVITAMITPFRDDLSIDFFLKGYDLNWAEVLESCIKGDVFLKYEFSPNADYMLTLRQKEKIEFISGRTKSNIKRYVEELELDTKELDEAKKIWKY